MLERTLTQPVAEMIARGGGIEPSIASGERYVRDYRALLANEDAVRAEYRGLGKSEAWIEGYLLSVHDGITINQAFVDAVRCHRDHGLLPAAAAD